MTSPRRRFLSWLGSASLLGVASRPSLAPVIVLRHLSFMLAVNDAFWSDYDVGKYLKMRDERGRKWATKNPLGIFAVLRAQEAGCSYGLASC